MPIDNVKSDGDDIFLCGSFNEENENNNRTFAYLGKVDARKEGIPLRERKKIFLDCRESHVVLICGKKGSGKSYTMGVLVEELARIMESYPNQLSLVIIDTMGTFLGLGDDNKSLDQKTKDSWGIAPHKFENIKIYVAFPTMKKVKDRRRKFLYSPEKVESLYLRPGDLDPSDFVFLADWDITQPSGALLSECVNDAIENVKAKNGTTDDLMIEDILDSLESLSKDDIRKNIKIAVSERLKQFKNWNIFSSSGIGIKDLVKPGQISIIDLSLQGFSSKAALDTLLLSIFTRKIYEERMISIKTVPEGQETVRNRGIPLVWLVIDEAHKYLQADSYTKNDLKRWVQQGRAPGLGTVMATQNPGLFPLDIITNMDILIAHKLITKSNIDVVEKMAAKFDFRGTEVFENLPDQKGAAVIVDTENSDAPIIGFIRPRMTHHTGTSEKIKED